MGRESRKEQRLEGGWPGPLVEPRGAVLRWFGAAGRDAMALLYPELCPLCGGPGSELGCREHRLPDPSRPTRDPHCGICARPLPACLPDGDTCLECRRRRPRFGRLLVLGEYRREPGLRAWLLALKHGGRRDLARSLGAALAVRYRRDLEERRGRPLGIGSSGARALFVPVPLHPLRRLERGFDQARLLARALGEELDAPMRELLRRVRWTPPQGTLGAASRSANVGAAFRSIERSPHHLRGVSVWLVDDVVTSGATVEACAAALGKLGARSVGVIALARAGLPGAPGASEAPRAPGLSRTEGSRLQR